ncbi:efflux RND transporter permease subunit [Parahaliea maris]|uniref:Efflux RND transporter permease subunit n=1 Tax=Parahaliea maris TaxID=2716870 RepID=A0A5C8ZZT7_9GAMM|nr:efflux RND transporter permease subunit [Parahaliea maris]TXS94016.1 efflux RND transporter permease subunit [Parahaliea maris]
MIAWFARNAVAANLLMFSIVMGGILALKTELTLEIFPDPEPDTISISVALRSATPEDVELGVATRIEEAVQDLEGIDRMTSQSVEGSTTVTLELDDSYDARSILDDVKGRVDAINTFPAEAEKPVTSLAMRRRAVIDVVVAGALAEDELLNYAEQVRDDLLRIDGISQVDLSSVRNYEIAVEASQDRLRQYSLSLADIAAAISDSSLDISAGNLRAAGGDVLIRSKGQAYRRSDFERIVVKTNPDGSIIRIADIARVSDGFEEESLKTAFNGSPAAFVKVYRVGDQSALDVATKVKKYLAERRSSLPVGMHLDFWDDDSTILRSRLGTMLESGIEGAVLVILLLALFLRPAIGFWVFIGIPVSFLGGIIVMGMTGTSLNVMSAMGFIIALGLVVDDAIVTGENVYTHLRESESGLQAAIRGTQEVATPVTFGVLTTIAAFLPIAFIEGRMGAMFAPIPAVVIPVLLFSLIESKFVLPAHLAHIRMNGASGQRNRWSQWQNRFATRFEQLILRHYQPLLRVVTRHRYTTLAAFTGALLLIAALVASGWTRFVFFPNVEGETGRAELTMPVGTPFEVTDQFITRIGSAAQELQERYRDPGTGASPIVNILTVTGSGGGRGASANQGRVTFELTPAQDRSHDMTTTRLVDEWRKLVGSVAGAESLTFRSTMFRAGEPVDVQLSGKSLETLSAVGEQVKERLASYAGVFDIADSLSDGKEELHIELTQQGHALGLTRNDVVNQVGRAYKGAQAQRIQRGRDDIRVLVRLPRSERNNLETLNTLLIDTPQGGRVPLSHVATLTPDKGPSSITRVDGYRVLNITADVQKGEVNMTALQAELSAYLDQLLQQFPGTAYSLEGEAREQRESFGSMQAGLVAVVFVIYCLLALPLRSYTQPLVVMSVIPFGLIGAVLGHWLLGQALTLQSLLGMMALVGVLVNDSLVLVDYCNQKVAAGERLQNAVITAGVSRFRPVFLTSMTTFLGLLPLLTERATDAQFLIPMAISLGFGILFATLITLFLVPTNLLIAQDISRLLGRARGLPQPVPS